MVKEYYFTFFKNLFDFNFFASNNQYVYIFFFIKTTVTIKMTLMRAKFANND